MQQLSLRHEAKHSTAWPCLGPRLLTNSNRAQLENRHCSKTTTIFVITNDLSHLTRFADASTIYQGPGLWAPPTRHARRHMPDVRRPAAIMERSHGPPISLCETRPIAH